MFTAIGVFLLVLLFNIIAYRQDLAKESSDISDSSDVCDECGGNPGYGRYCEKCGAFDPHMNS